MQVNKNLLIPCVNCFFTAKCPDGYKLYNNVCYKYFPGPVNWVQASEKCAAEFSSLTSIENQAEEFFIRTVLVSLIVQIPEYMEFWRKR